MAGESKREEYLIEYAASFTVSLRENIREWEEELKISEEKIRGFVQSINRSISLLKFFLKCTRTLRQSTIFLSLLIES